jgi:Tfp pilus assembly protein PilN
VRAIEFGSPLKPSRQNKVIGLAIGETSLTAAEVVAGDRPASRLLAEFVYPAGVSITEPAALGAALGQFLKENDFTAKAAVVGIPARWLVVKPKDVPPADAKTVAELLRLQAEGEFSSELKDLVYDYAAGGDAHVARSVLLIATARKYVDAAVAICTAAKLNAIAVMPSAVALSAATGAVSKDALVLTISGAGAELTAQSKGVPSAIRHLNGPGQERSFVGELRRAVSALPSNGTAREMVVWDPAGMDAASLGTSLGFSVRSGDLPVLGVDISQAERNGDGRRYAAAVALGLAGIGEERLPIDFLHSRLAPPRAQRVPNWVIAAVVGGVVLIGSILLGYTDLQRQQAKLDQINAQLDSEKADIKDADLFVSKVSVAQAWHGGNPRYLACVKDLTNSIPEDMQTYATSLHINETARPPAAPGTPASRVVEVRTLTGQLLGKTGDQQQVQAIMDRMKRIPAFVDVKNGGSQETGRSREVSFSINFVYQPAKSAQ